MRLLLVLLAGLLVCGCIYDVPLVEKAELPVDAALTGIWQEIPAEGKPEDPDDRMVILPFSDTEYIAVIGPGEDALYFRAYPIRLDGMELVQLKWLNGGEDAEPYTVCRYSLKDGILTVEYLNKDVVDPKIKDSSALRDALLANRENSKLFGDPGRYRKLED